MVVERQLIPEDLAGMAPGPGLAAVLAGLDIGRLSGYDAVVVLQAYARLEAHVQAAKAAVMAEVGLYEVSSCDMKKMDEPDKYSADEIRAALVLTRRAAEREYGFAYDLKARLPEVREALSAGLIDKPRALVFCDWLEDVPAELARAVAGQLLPRTGGWTTGELKDKIKRLLIAADPTWARRKYERAIGQRRIEGMRHADGSATITGHQLPVDQAAAAIARVDAIASAAKRAGLGAPIDHARADVFLGLLDGTLTGLNDDAIIAVLLKAAAQTARTEDDYDDQLSDHPDDPDDPDDLGDPDHPDGHPSHPGNLHHQSDDPSSPARPSDSDGPGEPPSSPNGPITPGGPPNAHSRVDQPDDPDDPGSPGQPSDSCGPGDSAGLAGLGDTGDRSNPRGGLRYPGGSGDQPHDLGSTGDLSDSHGPGQPALAGRPTGGLPGFAAGEVRVRVSTLMHLDDLPAELAGWGPVHAELARRMVKQQIGGEWRFALCDESGQLIFAGITRYRPAGWSPRAASGSVRQRGIVELQIPLALLRVWHAERSELGGWARVIGDITRQLDRDIGVHTPAPPPPSPRTDQPGDNQPGTHPTAHDQPHYDRPHRKRPPGDGPGGGERLGTHPPTSDQSHGDRADREQSPGDQPGCDQPGAHRPGGDQPCSDRASQETAGSTTGTTGAIGAMGAWSGSGDERRRLAAMGLRRWVQIRDRVCSHPGCRAPATRAELDHTREYAKGGTTVDANLAAACAHDHDLRDHGWRVTQTAPGHLVWISRTGHRYPVQPPPIIEPLPEPLFQGPLFPEPLLPGSGVPRRLPSGGGVPSASEVEAETEAGLPTVASWEFTSAWWEEAQTGPQPAAQSQPSPGPARDHPATTPGSTWDVPPF